MPDDFNDDLDALFSSATRGAPKPARVVPTSYVKPEVMFEEGCPKCRGTGRFISYSGRQLGECFACKGAGKKVFKTSTESRAKARAKSAQKIGDAIVAFREREPEVFAWLNDESQKAKPFEFAIKMIEALGKYGDLTDAQLDACKRGVERAKSWKAERETKAVERVANAPTVDVTVIEEAFKVARERAARPGQAGTFTKPLMLKAGDVSLSFFPGSIGSKWEGMLFAKTVDDKKLGHIKDGKFIARFECTPVEQDAVLACASQPKEALLAYAKAWKRCGICSRLLLNDESIARGIGPICASKFGWSL